MLNKQKEKERQRRWVLANPDKVNAKSKKWKLANPEKVKAAWQKYAATHQSEIRNRKLLRKYNLTEKGYIELFENQKGVCKICNLPELTKRLIVDHDHSTGKIRGLLCDNCNRGLGLFKDDKKVLLLAINYIK